MGDFNSYEIWESKKTNKKNKIIESLLNKHQLYMNNNRSNTHLNPATGPYSAIDLIICDSNLFLGYDWKVHDNTCGSDYFPILLQNKTNKLNKRT